MGMRLGNVIMGEGSVWEWDLVTWQIYSDCRGRSSSRGQRSG